MTEKRNTTISQIIGIGAVVVPISMLAAQQNAVRHPNTQEATAIKEAVDLVESQRAFALEAVRQAKEGTVHAADRSTDRAKALDDVRTAFDRLSSFQESGAIGVADAAQDRMVSNYEWRLRPEVLVVSKEVARSPFMRSSDLLIAASPGVQSRLSASGAIEIKLEKQEGLTPEEAEREAMRWIKGSDTLQGDLHRIITCGREVVLETEFFLQNREDGSWLDAVAERAAKRDDCWRAKDYYGISDKGFRTMVGAMDTYVDERRRELMSEFAREGRSFEVRPSIK